MQFSTEKIYTFVIINLLTIIFTVSAFQKALAQEDIIWNHYKSIKTPKISTVSIDRYGFIYIADDRGNVHLYDTIGNFMLNYSPRQNNEVTLLEAWRKVNIFVFNNNYQEYVILDRFLTASTTHRLRSEDVGFARLATLSADQNIWVIDEKEFSLKKINIRYNKTEIVTPLDLILNPNNYNMTFMREYQNLLFISDRNSGILVFDNLGSYKAKIPLKNVNFFSFRGDQLYFVANDKIWLYNIYTKEEQSVNIPVNYKFDYILLAQDKAYGFTNSSMEIFILNLK